MREDLLPTTFNGALVRVVEESSEVTKVICKIQRFGFRPTDYKTGITYDNLGDLRAELLDLNDAILRLAQLGHDQGYWG